MDIAAIEAWRDFWLIEQVASCGVLLAIIGKNWLTAQDEAGARWLNPMDFVRLETASALLSAIFLSCPCWSTGQECRVLKT